MGDLPVRRRELLKLTGGGVIGTAGFAGVVAAKESTEDDNRLVWESETGTSSWSSPTVVDGTVFVGGDDGNIHAVDATTGDEQWVFETYSWIESSPTVVDGTVFVGAENDYVYALDAATGDERWSRITGWYVTSSPTVVDDNVFVGSHNGYVYALDATTGDEQWAFETGSSVGSSPTVVGGTVFIGNDDGTVHALDAATGDVQWAFDTGARVRSSPTVEEGTVFVGSYDDNVYALTAASGNEQWAFETGERVRSSPTVVDGTVFVGSHDGNVYAMNTATGDEQWAFETGSSVGSSPTVVNGTVFVGSADESVYALDAATGNEQWAFETGSTVQSSPTVVDGTVFIGNSESLYALDAGVEGSSEDSRVNLGTLGHHHGWTGGEPDGSDPPADGLVVGSVTDAGGVPLEAATIEAEETEGESIVTTETDNDGAYTLELPGDATYALTAEKDGFDPSSETVAVEPEGTHTVEFTLVETEYPLEALEPTVESLLESTEGRLDDSSAAAADVFLEYTDDVFGLDPERYLLDAMGVTEATFAVDLDEDASEFERLVNAELAGRSLETAEHGIERVLEAIWTEVDEELRSTIADATDTFLSQDWFIDFAFGDPSTAVSMGYEVTPFYQDAERRLEDASEWFESLATEEPTDEFDLDTAADVLAEVTRQLTNRRYGVPGVVILPNGATYQYDQTETYAAAYDGTLTRIDATEATQTAAQVAKVAGGALVLTGKGAPVGAFLMKAGTKTYKAAELANTILKTRLAFEWALTQLYWAVDVQELAAIPETTLDWLEEATETGLAPADVRIEDVELNLEDAAIRTDYVRANRPEAAPGWLPVTLQSVAVGEAEVTVRNDGANPVDVRVTMHDQHGGGESVSNEGAMDPPLEEDPISIEPEDSHTFDMEYAADYNGLLDLHTMSIDVWVDGVRRASDHVEFQVRRGIELGRGDDAEATHATDNGDGDSAVRDSSMVVTTGENAHDEALTVDELDDLRPRDERLVEDELTPEEDTVEYVHTPGDDTRELQYILSGTGSIGLQLEDESGTVTGYDPTEDAVRTDLPGSSFVGPDVTPQRVRLLTDGETSYTVSVHVEEFGSASTIPVGVDVVEIPERDAVLSVSPSERRAALSPGMTESVSFEIEEAGEQVDIEAVEIDPGTFTHDGTELEDVEASPTATAFDVEAGDDAIVTIEFTAGDELALPEAPEDTRFEGTVTIETANAGSVDVAISALALSTTVDDARLLGADRSVTGVELSAIDPATLEGEPPAATDVLAAYQVAIGGSGSVRLELPREPEADYVFAYATGEEWTRLETGRSSETLRVGVTPSNGTVAIALLAEPFTPYLSSDNRVETSGLRAAIDDWRADEIETEHLREVIDYWRSGEPID